MRQALLWLGPQAGDEQYYDTWMQRHPQDSEVQNYFRQRRSGQARGQGYANLNSGNTAAAKQQFEEVLQTNPQDADALAGMGYIAQRSGDYQAASQYLSRAADLGGGRLGDPSSAGGRCAVLRPAGAGPSRPISRAISARRWRSPRRWRSRAGRRAPRRSCSAPMCCGTTKIGPRRSKRCAHC
ncbi:tetratricopeptide repeat protein [Klebsiella pneumoniae subsp. pneumoniae]|nr:tetratricopeptide repeat protein [Klebsiella pneumoniae subsp. pneumoniae]